MLNRLWETCRRINKSVQQRPLLYFLLLIFFHLIEDRVAGWANNRIDSAASGGWLTLIMARIIHWLDSTPGGLLIALVVITFLAVGIHAYFDARRKPKMFPDLTPIPEPEAHSTKPMILTKPTIFSSPGDWQKWDQSQTPEQREIERLSSKLAEVDKANQIKADEIQRLETELANSKSESEEKTKTIQTLRHSQYMHGQWRVTECGRDCTPLGWMVVVQFSESRDSDLAKAIRGLFWHDTPWETYKAAPVEQTLWRDNPSSRARIVIFSDHDHAAGIKAAINDCDLLPEKVDQRDKQAGMAADITIIIFDKIGKESW